jgi:hypothetical protein
MKFHKIILILFSSVPLLAFITVENDTNYHTINSLFKIERSKDANQIYYDVNLNISEELSCNNPITIY